MLETHVEARFRDPSQELRDTLRKHKIPLWKWTDDLVQQLRKEQIHGLSHLSIDNKNRLVRVVPYVALIEQSQNCVKILEHVERVLPGESPIETISRVVDPGQHIIFESHIIIPDREARMYPGLPTRNSIFLYKVQFSDLI